MRLIPILLASAFIVVGHGPWTASLAAPAESAPPTPKNAFSVWAGDGHLVQTGSESVVIIGTFGGPLFTNIDAEPDDVGAISCPMTLQLNLASDSLIGNGSCAFTADDGAQAFGTWTCTGKFREGCGGEFRITSGNGRLKDVRTTSSFVLRGRMAEFVTYPTEQVSAIGFAVWKDFQNITNIPSANYTPSHSRKADTRETPPLHSDGHIERRVGGRAHWPGPERLSAAQRRELAARERNHDRLYGPTDGPVDGDPQRQLPQLDHTECDARVPELVKSLMPQPRRLLPRGFSRTWDVDLPGQYSAGGWTGGANGQGPLRDVP
jgi:hypothetical protein